MYVRVVPGPSVNMRFRTAEEIETPFTAAHCRQGHKVSRLAVDLATHPAMTVNHPLRRRGRGQRRAFCRIDSAEDMKHPVRRHPLTESVCSMTQ